MRRKAANTTRVMLQNAERFLLSAHAKALGAQHSNCNALEADFVASFQLNVPVTLELSCPQRQC